MNPRGLSRRRLGPIGLLSFTTFFLFLLVTSGRSAAAPTTFTVNSTGDGADATIGDGICAEATGACTLRAAIQESNASVGDKDTIGFGIPAAPFTIAPATVLPDISDPVVIDGTTQTGWVDDPIVELRGPGTWGLKITAGDSTIRGLVINRFTDEVVLETNGGNIVAGNFIGTDSTGTQDGGGQSTDHSQLEVLSGDGNRLGGTTPEDRNVIAGAALSQVSVFSSDNVIQGNFIGTNAAGDAVAGGNQSLFGVLVERVTAVRNLIGGLARAPATLSRATGTVW